MLSIRIWHTYIGILIAPSVIFFSLTGALQIFNLHESHGRYRPPVLIEELSMLHKDQVFARKPRDEDGPDSRAGIGKPPPPAAEEDVPPLGTVLLKWFFLFVALALATSTLLGLWMGLTQGQRRRKGWWLLAAGILLPVTLCIL